MNVRCPHCQETVDVVDDQTAVLCPKCNSRITLGIDESETFELPSNGRIGHFELNEIVGEGGFGVVYRAWDRALKRHVAIKIPRADRLTRETARRFVKEARAAARISHPNVVAVHEIGTHNDSFYIASEFVDGPTLSSYLKSHHFEPADAARFVIKLLRAVQVFHEQGIIHRDLKPGNILMDQSGEPKITDFGLAMFQATDDSSQTRTGHVLGTLRFMAAEQVMGDRANISARTDVYAIGVILYILLTGTLPFPQTDTVPLLTALLDAEPPPPRTLNRKVPSDLQIICLKALEKDPDDRYPSAGEMADDVQRFLDGQTIVAKPASRAKKLWRLVKRNRLVTTALGVGGLATAAAVYFFANPPLAPTPEGPTQEVQIECRLVDGGRYSATNAEWAAAKLNPDRQPMADHIVRSKGERADLKLEPGEYLVAVEVPGFGFHEVYRTVPAERSSAPGSLNPQKFEWLPDGKVRLPPIHLMAATKATSEMAFLRGGKYNTGTVGNPFSPPCTFEIADFYVDRHEVTYNEFLRILPEPSVYFRNLTLPKGDCPVVGVSWYEAAHCAEALGCRLLTEIEWEYAATNGGTTEFPWGDDPDQQPPWGLNSVDAATSDITPDTKIKGLFSNAAEITSSVLAPYPGGEMLESAKTQSRFGFAYRGGPTDVLEIVDQNSTYSVKQRSGQPDRNQKFANLGFRVGYSKRSLTAFARE